MVNTMPGIEVDTHTINRYDGIRITVTSGDFVKMEPSDLKFASSCIAGVERLYETPERESVMLVRWYFRPEDTPEGRKPFHGLKELFLSDRYDVQRADCIRYKYVVHSLDKFLARKNVGADDYFCRYEYITASKHYIPMGDRVGCKCVSPLNPDAFMLQCDRYDCKVSSLMPEFDD